MKVHSEEERQIILQNLRKRIELLDDTRNRSYEQSLKDVTSGNLSSTETTAIMSVKTVARLDVISQQLEVLISLMIVMMEDE